MKNFYPDFKESASNKESICPLVAIENPNRIYLSGILLYDLPSFNAEPDKLCEEKPKDYLSLLFD